HVKKVIGLCNIPSGQKTLAAQILGQSEGDLSTRHIGLNLFHFHEVWDKYGENRTQVILETLFGDFSEEMQEAVKNITNLEFLFN
ncbi:6-phospho-beta-glucosidase, partial [Streptococcus suis]